MVSIAEPFAKPVSRYRFILDRREVLGVILVAPAILYVLLLVGVPVSTRGLLLGQRLHDLRSFVAFRRPCKFRADPPKSGFSRDTGQHLLVHIWIAVPRACSRQVRGASTVAAVPGA